MDDTLNSAWSPGQRLCLLKNPELPLSQQPHLILQEILTPKISLQHLSCLQAKEMDFGERSVDQMSIQAAQHRVVH